MELSTLLSRSIASNKNKKQDLFALLPASVAMLCAQWFTARDLAKLRRVRQRADNPGQPYILQRIAASNDLWHERALWQWPMLTVIFPRLLAAERQDEHRQLDAPSRDSKRTPSRSERTPSLQQLQTTKKRRDKQRHRKQQPHWFPYQHWYPDYPNPGSSDPAAVDFSRLYRLWTIHERDLAQSQRDADRYAYRLRCASYWKSCLGLTFLWGMLGFGGAMLLCMSLITMISAWWSGQVIAEGASSWVVTVHCWASTLVAGPEFCSKMPDRFLTGWLIAIVTQAPIWLVAGILWGGFMFIAVGPKF